MEARAAPIADVEAENTRDTMDGTLSLPLGILTDSYKASHFLQYPKATRMVAYGEFRQGYDGDTADRRIIWYALDLSSRGRHPGHSVYFFHSLSLSNP